MTPRDSEIKLLLLDFDGTLADTRRANTLAYVATLAEAGYALTEEEYEARYFGMRCEEFLTRLGIADAAERERLRLRKIALYPSFFDTYNRENETSIFSKRNEQKLHFFAPISLPQKTQIKR